MALNFAKLKKFEGVDFIRWQKKMHFMLSSMSVVYVLTTPMPEDGGDNPTVDQVKKRAKWDNDDYVCRGLILNGMSNSLFDTYQNVETSKKLWDTLEAKYMVEDASSNKFLVSNFTKYKMTDSRPVLEQYNELLGILERFTQHKMNMDESIQVSCIIDKLPPSWKDFKHTLKYLKEELTLVELGSHLHIEESLRVYDNDKPKGNNVVGPSVVNVVEHNNSSRYNDNRGKRKHHDTKVDPNKKPKVYYVTYVSEAYLVMDDDVTWWVDSGATVHVCKDRCWFKTYESLNVGSILYMRNESTALVHGRGCVNLRLNIVFDNIGSAFMSTSKQNDYILWHARLGHVHFKRMRDMSKDGLIPAFDMDTEKCKTCILTKITKKPFQNVKGKTEVLELIHSDLCNLHATPSLGNKKYFVTFIDYASRAVVRLPNPKMKTLGERGIECIFVGYAGHSKAFRPSQRSLVNRTEDFGGSVVPEKVTGEVVQQPEPELRKRKRHRTPKDFGPEFQLYLIERTMDEGSDQHSYFFNVEDDPKTFDEAMKSRMLLSKKKQLMMRWIPSWATTLGCWLIYLQGFKQKSWIDYSDTYALMARIGIIRLLIAMTSIHNLIIHQMDVKTAFLNGELDKEVYMNQPQGFIMHGNENKVYKLIKSLYGLKHAPKKFDESGKEVIICLYVDDMLIFGTNQVQVDLIKEFLSSRFSMKDIGEADVIRGIKIKYESNGIAISQSYYIEKVLKKFNYFECTSVSTPMDTSEKLMPNNSQVVSQLEYSRVIGYLMYAMTCTRPDIAFIVGKLRRYTSNPGTQYWQAIQNVMKYLKKTMDYRLMCTGYPSVLEGYTDASWINNTEDNSSTSGWVSMTHIWRAIMEEHRASMEAYKRVHNKTMRSELRMTIVQQSMEMNMWEIKEKLVERREQMAIRAYEEEKRRAELNQKIEEDKRREAWKQKIKEDKKREEWNQKIEKMINLIQSFIQNPTSSIKTPQPVTTKIMEKGVGKEGIGCALNKSKGSHLGLRHCAANRKRKKRKGPFVWTKSKSRVVIEVEQTEAIDGGLNCDNRLANYEQLCQHFLMFDYDPQEGELQKQNCITGSTIKSEFVALAAAGKEAEWLKNLLLKIALWVKPTTPISIRYDSAATLAKAYSQMYNGKSIHIGVRHSMIHELIMNGVVSIEFVRSQQNLVDYLTKGLARDLVIKSVKGMGLKSN
ncbi:zinc finger, CCHC-type containing protein [Tanacetum coccineum]